MSGSDKDKEGSRDLMRGRSTASRSSPAKRQPTGTSSPFVSNDNVDCNGRNGVDAYAGMVRWKKAARAPRWRLGNNEASGEASGGRSDGEEGDHFRSMLSTKTTTKLTSRKRVRLHGKVAEDTDVVDPAPVPRKLRSAINKRNSHSSSPPMPDAKEKCHHSSNGLQILYRNIGRKCKQHVPLDSFTKDEELVVEALCALSRMLPMGEQISYKEDRRVLEGQQDNNTTLATHQEAEEDKKISQHCAANGIKSPSSCMEKPLEKTMKDEYAPSKQSVTVCGRQAIDSHLNRTPETDTHTTPLSKNEHSENTPFRNLMNFSSPSGVLPHYTGNSVLHPTQCDEITALQPCKSNILHPNECVGSAAQGHEVQQSKHYNESSAKLLFPEGTFPPDIQPSLSNSAICHGSATGSARLISSGLDLPTMVPSWKKCAIHVSIGHLIKSYQDKEKQCTMLQSSQESRCRNGSKLSVPANNEKTGLGSGSNGVASVAINGSMVEKNKREGRNEVLCNGRLMPAHQSSALSEAKQKQTCDSVSLSAAGDASNSRNRVQSSGQLYSPFLHAQFLHHSLVPYPLPHVSYAPPYTDKLVAAATQQMQLQVPHFVGNPFYGSQIDNTISNTQLQQQQYQQQQIWQAHFAQYRSLVGDAALPNEWPNDSSASVCQSVQASSTISPSPSIQMQGGSHHPPVSRRQHQLVNASSSSSSSKAKPQQQHRSPHGSRFRHEGPNQLQLLYDTSQS